MIVDYSLARPAPASLVALGAIGAMRYLGTDSRCVTVAELEGLHAVGLGVGLIAEADTQTWHPPLEGFARGQDHGQLYNALADRLGTPADVPIFYAVDFQPTDAQVRGPIADYFRGVLSVGGRPARPYGCDLVLNILCGELGLMPCGWQCQAWSGGRRSAYACMFQNYPPIAGGSLDANDVLMDAGAWLWHPDRPITGASPAPVFIEELRMKRFTLNGAEQQWRLSSDYGQDCKVKINTLGQADAYRQLGVVDNDEKPVNFNRDDNPELFDFLANLPEPSGQWAPVVLTAKVIAEVGAATERVVAAVTNQPAGQPVDPAELAKQLAHELTELLERAAASPA